MIEHVKLGICLGGYCIVAPAAGMLAARSRTAQKCLFVLMLALTALHPDLFTLTPFGEAGYLGHTRGFEFSLIDMAAIAILCAVWRERGRPTLTPPLALPWLFYCAMGALTLILTMPFTLPASLNSLEDQGAWIQPFWIWTAIVKFPKFLLPLLATHAWIRKREDVLFLFRVIAGVLLFALVASLKQRYLDGRYQVRAGFEHQNQLAMWAYMAGLTCLAIGLAPGIRMRTALWLVSGYGAATAVIALTISRGGIALLVGGSVLIAGVFVLRHLSWKTIVIVLAALAAGGGVAIKSFDTIAGMFEAKTDIRGGHNLRVILADQARTMLDDSFFGVGWNNYTVAASRPVLRYSAVREEGERDMGFSFREERYERNGLAESYYWVILAEMGYPGFVAFAAFLIWTLWLALRNAWAQRSSWMGYALASIALVLMLTYAHSNLERVMAQLKNATLWFVLLGIVSRAETARRRQRRQVRERSAGYSRRDAARVPAAAGVGMAGPE
ncbi:MAG TPA: hypothetical protein VMN36_04435 [Verrucomicrobiales bacterium]|nr:hypothetical protein [Verrucomicrobiales bacterium]